MIPQYDFVTHKRSDEWVEVKAQPLILFEGIFALLESRMRKLMDLKIFVQTDDDIRLSRRLYRDCRERGFTPLSVLQAYH